MFTGSSVDKFIASTEPLRKTIAKNENDQFYPRVTLGRYIMSQLAKKTPDGVRDFFHKSIPSASIFDIPFCKKPKNIILLHKNIPSMFYVDIGKQNPQHYDAIEAILAGFVKFTPKIPDTVKLGGSDIYTAILTEPKAEPSTVSFFTTIYRYEAKMETLCKMLEETDIISNNALQSEKEIPPINIPRLYPQLRPNVTKIIYTEKQSKMKIKKKIC